MKLIIVESPAKAKTIKNFLDDDYCVVASKGHIRDLPKRTFGIKIQDKHFNPEYEISKDHKDVIEQIKKLSKNAEIVYIATDEDREGEAIGYHINQIINKDVSYPRIVFHEITKKAILDALKNPRDINMDMVNAQQTRRLLDRIVGFKLSPLLNQKIQKGLSAGRVQSSALKLVVDREKEIREFKPIDYFSIDAIFENGKDKVESILIEWEGKKIDKLTLQDKVEASKICEHIKDSNFFVKEIETKVKKVSPPAPFMTSTLQQSASSNLGYSPSKTMQIAQRLYEGVLSDQGVMGLITYMRTDSLNIAKVAQDDARKLIEKNFGESYIPKKPRIYTTKHKSAQEAHEAIRPTRIDFTPQIAKDYLKGDELKLYTLIYNRFLASQSSDAVFESQSAFISDNKAIFKASGSKLVFDGFHKILGSTDKDKILSPLIKDTNLALLKCELNAHQTEPLPRFSEASLVKTLEGLGIGRPSTYAPTIALLSNREYIKIEKKQIFAMDISFVVIDMLEKNFLEIVDSNFTAKLEEKLDKIADSKLDWQGVLWDFYEPFNQKVSDGKTNIASLKIAKQTGQFCPTCGKELVIRNGRYGEFIACSGYPKCKYIKQDDTDNVTNEKCELCGSDMVKKVGRYGEFIACSGYPKCKNIIGQKQAPKNILDGVNCPLCGGGIIKRFSRRGAFFGCSNYPKCDFISNNEPVNIKCKECGYLMAKKETKTKKYLQCLKCKTKEDLS